MLRKSLVAGQVFGNLTVLGFSTKKRNSDDKILYECKCICGKYIDVEENQLKSGNIRSCGCRNKKIRNIKHDLTYFIDRDFYQERRDRIQEFEIQKMVEEIKGEKSELESPF